MLECSFDYITTLKEGALFSPHRDRFSFVILCHGENFYEEPFFKKLDYHSEGRLKRALELASDFKGKEGQHLYFSALSEKIAHIHLIGCDTSSQGVKAEALGGAVIKALGKSLYCSEACLFVPSSLRDYAYEIAIGAVLKNYSFTHYQTKKKQTHSLKALHLLLSCEEGQDLENFKEHLNAHWEEEGKPLCDAVFWARDVVNEPANILTPESYMQRIKALETKGLEIEVLDRQRMEKEGFGALLGVAKGSDIPPYTVIMRHYGASTREEAPLAFIGKGVTFDSGGISIKPAAGMDEMKADMGGSASVIGVMSALAGRKARVNAIGVVGLVENMVSGRAQRPGDIVTSHSGQTIEVLNTDAEGRLVLADLLSYTKQTYQPKLMINLATLTGAIIVALGTEHAGLFSNDDALADSLLKVGKKIDETLWRMPLGEAYNRQLNSDIADMKNIGGRPGSSILAAEFLKRFVGETKWAHLDIAGVAWKNKASSFTPKGATGYGVRLLNAFVKEYEIISSS